jgi:protein-S-isoprenylcysteine O-methyltransferase Ste14
MRIIMTPLGALFFLGIISLTVYVSFFIDRRIGLPQLLHVPWNILVSLPMLITGVILWLWSLWQFVKVKGTPVPFNPPQKLVTSGPYGYVRNPMLSGVFVILFGVGVLFQSIALTFIFTPLFALFCILEFKFIEEPELEMRLGEDYIKYKKAMPLLFPKGTRFSLTQNKPHH